MRRVYRHVLPGSANQSVLGTLPPGEANPDFCGRKAADAAVVQAVIAAVDARAAELATAWNGLARYREVSAHEVVLADRSAVPGLCKDYDVWAGTMLADLEDRLALLMDHGQFEQVMDAVVRGWVFRRLGQDKNTTRLFKLRRDVGILSFSYYLDVMAAAVGETGPFVELLRRHCPACGIVCGWDPSLPRMYLHRVQW